MLAGLGAAGEIDRVMTWFAERLVVAPLARLHLEDEQGRGETGALAVPAKQLRVLMPYRDNQPVTDRELTTRQVNALSATFEADDLFETRARGRAQAFVAAKYHRVPLVTHDARSWAAGEPAGVPRRILVEGVLSVAVWVVQTGRLGRDPARKWHDRVVSCTGTTPGYAVSDWELDDLFQQAHMGTLD
jgi:hypothetical protein